MIVFSFLNSLFTKTRQLQQIVLHKQAGLPDLNQGDLNHNFCYKNRDLIKIYLI